ncbi:MAG: prepilin-type N-terminal cleavage/methylation domain-containing protein [Pseudomonadales bacterium]
MTIKLINRGFTLVELLVTLTIAAVLFGFALPAFNGMMAQRTMTARVNQFVLAVNYARSEAAKLGGVVSIQSVDSGDTDNEWGLGYCVAMLPNR